MYVRTTYLEFPSLWLDAGSRHICNHQCAPSSELQGGWCEWSEEIMLQKWKNNVS